MLAYEYFGVVSVICEKSDPLKLGRVVPTAILHMISIDNEGTKHPDAGYEDATPPARPSQIIGVLVRPSVQSSLLCRLEINIVHLTDIAPSFGKMN